MSAEQIERIFWALMADYVIAVESYPAPDPAQNGGWDVLAYRVLVQRDEDYIVLAERRSRQEAIGLAHGLVMLLDGREIAGWEDMRGVLGQGVDNLLASIDARLREIEAEQKRHATAVKLLLAGLEGRN